MSKKKIFKCYNCRHGGRPFKLSGKTHLHCEHPKIQEEAERVGELFHPFGTLKEFWETCEDHELMIKKSEK
jgi:hypothetical protein